MNTKFLIKKQNKFGSVISFSYLYSVNEDGLTEKLGEYTPTCNVVGQVLQHTPISAYLE